MIKKKEDNVVFVLQKAIRQFKIKVTNTTVKEYLLAHPHYPSLKSVCDALKKWEVEHFPLNLELNEIKALKLPFIAHFKSGGGQLAFVQEINKNEVNYFLSTNKVIIEDFDKFSEKLSGAVVLMEGNENSGEKDYRTNRQKEILDYAISPLGILSMTTLAIWFLSTKTGSPFFQTEYLLWGLVATKIIGLTASIFLVLHELKVHTPLADKICGFSSKTDCDTVLSSNASKLFGWVNWADAGLIYFSGTILFLVGAGNKGSLWPLALLGLFALPYPVFSIYYQAFKAKKWCPFCLLVQLVLVAEFILLLPALYPVDFKVLSVFFLFVSFLIPASLWLTFKAFYNTQKEKLKDHNSYLQFKLNPYVFRFLLTENGYEEIKLTKNSMVLGNKNAPVTLTAFLSLYCNPCASAFKQLTYLLDNCPEIKINTVFSMYNDDESKKVFNTLYFNYKNKGQKETMDFLSKWYSMPKENRKALFSNDLPEAFDIVEPLREENKELFDKHNIPGTPTIFVNGYKYPRQYEYSNIEYYIEELKLLNTESKRQEARANCH